MKRGCESMSKIEPFRKKPRYPWLAEIIRIDTPAGAREACAELSHTWRFYFDTPPQPTREATERIRAKNRAEKRLLIRAVCEAIRRCKAQLARKRLSASERTEFKEIIEIYQKWLKQHSLK